MHDKRGDFLAIEAVVIVFADCALAKTTRGIKCDGCGVGVGNLKKNFFAALQYSGA